MYTLSQFYQFQLFCHLLSLSFNYNRPLKNMGLNYVGLIIHGFFSQVIYSWPSIYPGLTSTNSNELRMHHKWKTVFFICGWESADEEANCMHCSTPFYTRDLSIHKLGDVVVLEPIPHDYQKLLYLRF